MYEIRKTAEFEAWFNGIRDSYTQKRLLARLRKVTLGNFGDISPIADGLWEMREHFGAGWRMYFVRYGKVVVVMLGGGSKATQKADIKEVKKLLQKLES
ncbi:type II toxin-antitoxin system RelE/ParE family toxin [Polynucleobacter sp. MWH-Mekk-B1]|jgi:putative addiction module killer protein|uniref:type II toxin-antitoxin system RelE/ParE family toxin n=1 Tax=Polynucleobacter finlandensis TaxID=1855894 RepID=UPI001C0E7267|nr:type II toxin-antitoxin system RelE/ParE family toxin [Polynucleobacter finlandensis]MBU3544002.1 type II toxin-antitoxin system RelE/ParE family toxin [Polynucleobacter finlandensis]